MIKQADIFAGKQLKKRRKICCLSQTDLASLVGVTFQQIQKYENGTNRISVGMLNSICLVLNVPPAYFFELVRETEERRLRERRNTNDRRKTDRRKKGVHDVTI